MLAGAVGVCVVVSAAVAAHADEEQRLRGSVGHPSSPSGLSEALWPGIPPDNNLSPPV